MRLNVEGGKKNTRRTSNRLTDGDLRITSTVVHRGSRLKLRREVSDEILDLILTQITNQRIKNTSKRLVRSSDISSYSRRRRRLAMNGFAFLLPNGVTVELVTTINHVSLNATMRTGRSIGLLLESIQRSW